jgi:RHS repeat-associated protein
MLRNIKSRNPADRTYNNIPSTFLFNRGFTRHVRETQFLRASANQKLIVERIPTVKHVGKHLDQFALINMNGRIYDPITARFLNPDNIVQIPDFTQSFNRYAYCFNNPLKYIDPSGYSYLAPDRRNRKNDQEHQLRIKKRY